MMKVILFYLSINIQNFGVRVLDETTLSVR